MTIISVMNSQYGFENDFREVKWSRPQTATKRKQGPGQGHIQKLDHESENLEVRMIPADVVQRCKQYRLKNNMTQQQFANQIGIRVQIINEIERSKCTWDPQLVSKLKRYI